MRPQHRVVCQVTMRRKLLFPTEEKAQRFMEYNSAEIKANSGHAPIRAYYCESCGGWHVTSQEKRWFTPVDYNIPTLVRKLDELDNYILKIYDDLDDNPYDALRHCNHANTKLQAILSKYSGEEARIKGMITMLNNLYSQLHDKGISNRKGQKTPQYEHSERSKRRRDAISTGQCAASNGSFWPLRGRDKGRYRERRSR